jgi:hypothetical protein
MLSTVYSHLVSYLLLFFLLHSFESIGDFLSRLFKLQNLPQSVVIALGISFCSVSCWYLVQAGLNLNICIIGLFIFAVFMIVIGFIRLLRIGCQFRTETLTLYLLLLASMIQSLCFTGFVELPIVSFGNNDLFTWTMTADHLFGLSGYDNVLPSGPVFQQHSQYYGWATNFILGLIAKLSGRLSLEVSTLFVLMFVTLNSLSVFEINRRFFQLRPVSSFAISLISSMGMFSIYIAYNGYLAQIFACWYYMALLTASIHLVIEDLKFNWIQVLFLYLFISLGLILSYSWGAVPLLVFSGIFIVISSVVFFMGSKKSRIGRGLVFLPLLALIISFSMLPKQSSFILQLIKSVAIDDSGFSLKMIFPTHLFSMPSLLSFPGIGGSYTSYLVFICIFIFIFIVLLRRLKGSNTRRGVLLIFNLFFFVTVSAYLLFFFLKGESYQSWKLASFVVLPVSFVPLSSLIALINQIIGLYLFVKFEKCLFVFSLFYILFIPLNIEIILYNDLIREFKTKALELEVDKPRNIVITAVDFDLTFVALNVFSQKFKLFPLGPTYVSPVHMDQIFNLDLKQTRFLFPRSCELRNHDGVGRFVIGKNLATLSNSKLDFKYGVECGIIQLVEGFSIIESWMTRSSGKTARFIFNKSPSGVNEFNTLLLDLSPLGEQEIVISVNDKIILKKSLHKRELIKLDISNSPPALVFKIDVSPTLRQINLTHDSFDTVPIGLQFHGFEFLRK